MSVIPRVHTKITEEYRTLVEDVGIVDRSAVGRLMCEGVDALDLINRLSTNALADLKEGRGAATVLTSNKGRIVDLLNVFMSGEDLLVMTSQGARQRVIEWVDFYTIMESVTINDRTGDTSMPSLVGPGAPTVLEMLTGNDVELHVYECMRSTIDGVRVLVCRTDFVRPCAYDLIVEKDYANVLWEMLLSVDLTPVGEDALDVLRIEQGIPCYDRELTEDFNPLEAGLRDFISFNKGCYVGQEVVARLDTYDKVQKCLVGLEWESDVILGDTMKLLSDGRQVGVVTSVAKSAMTGKGIGLGYVRRMYGDRGTVLGSDVAGVGSVVVSSRF